MKPRAKHVYPSAGTRLPAPVFFRSSSVPAEAATREHHHAWGELVYSFSGLMEVKLADRHCLAPPRCGIWLPPYTGHQGLNRYETSFCSVYVAQELCARLPAQPCAVTVSPLVRAMLEYLRDHFGAGNHAEEDQRLLGVLVDQLARAESTASYLPGTEDPLLQPVLQTLEANPGDSRSLAELARAANTTERTLMRRFQREFGMPFSEWRQRLRVVKAMPRLDAGDTVEHIALDLGYGSASSFIAMFKRMAGVTPDEFRNGQRAAGSRRRHPES
ncbi:AraC family transcriptional regulator [Noviherbaspirillum galbum]|uniref:Helix-turn-helix transcriptional regulator n=1 Tax=Noviherbaspirillum galbum TaxID=2709383 RepID=A0A6B3SVY3_9BURK|nr:helix-turn-helix transcriptional regulator [Noviherbaspirillum galbum]NEX62542.1 helix-turn-helix transcriptional regulator [Noviherbaspirillum galbum]